MQHPEFSEITFGNGAKVVAPNAQWLVWIIDVLHPSQQEMLFAAIKAKQEEMLNAPRIQVPEFMGPVEQQSKMN